MKIVIRWIPDVRSLIFGGVEVSQVVFYPPITNKRIESAVEGFKKDLPQSAKIIGYKLIPGF